MSIRDAFRKAMERLRGKSTVLVVGDEPKPITLKDVIKNKESKKIIPRYPENSNVIYYNPQVHYKEAVNKKSYLLNDRCSECDLKKKQIVKETTEEAVKKVFEDLSKLTDEEFKDEVDKHREEPECNPKTCWGECMGEGWCYIAKEWQERIHHWGGFVQSFQVLTKNQKKKKKKQYKHKKAKWQHIHNKRRR